MPHDLPKAYDPTAIEDRWAAYWASEKHFAQPKAGSGTALLQNQRPSGKFCVILLPLASVTGDLITW